MIASASIAATPRYFAGHKKTRLYTIWCAMRERCAKSPSYAGRGVTVCGEWLVWETFRDWAASSGYADDLSIDRIDVNGNYEPDNCRWITMAQQARNMRKTRYVMFRGEKLCLAEACEKAGVAYTLASYRLRHGWSDEDAFNIPAGQRRPDDGAPKICRACGHLRTDDYRFFYKQKRWHYSCRRCRTMGAARRHKQKMADRISDDLRIEAENVLADILSGVRQ